MAKGRLNVERLLEYAHRLGTGAVLRRLCFLLEVYNLASPAVLDSLKAQLLKAVLKLDPTLPADGRHRTDWGLQLNVTAKELLDAAHS